MMPQCRPMTILRAKYRDHGCRRSHQTNVTIIINSIYSLTSYLRYLEIQRKTVFTNGLSMHLVPKSVTLNDLERCYGPLFLDAGSNVIAICHLQAACMSRS